MKRLAFLVFVFILIPRSAYMESGVYYESDSNGIAYSIIPQYRFDDFEWVVFVQRESKSSEIRILFNYGVKTKTRKIEYDAEGNLKSETVLNGETISEFRRYGSSGQVIEETVYDSLGRAQESRKYFYRNATLSTIEVYNSTGKLIRTDEYVYSAKGALIEFRSYFPDGTKKTVGIPMQTTGDSWSLVNGDGVYTSFGKYGEVIRTDTYKNGEMHITVIFTYSYGSGKPICNSKEERNLVTKVSIITTFTDDGEVETIVYYKDGSIASEQKFNYENNILISIESLTAGSVEKKTYEYDSSNKLKVENLFKGGMLVSRIEYGDNDGEFIEELFTDGVLFARIYYVEGKKVKEEIIVDGTVVRTRAF